MSNKVLVIDIGGSAMKYGKYDLDGNELLKGKVKTPLDSLDNLTKQIQQLVNETAPVCGITISMPGIIDSKTGHAYTGGSLRYINNFDLAGHLQQATKLPVVIGNDAKSAALAEMGFGTLKMVDNAVMLVLGSGVGGAVIVNGKLVTGNKLAAGELSFISGNIHDYRDHKAMFGFSGGLHGLAWEIEKLTGKPNLDGISIFKLIRAGNQEVLLGVKNYCQNLAFHIYNLQAVLDPECFVIGGGISEEPMFLEILIDEVKDMAERLIMVPSVPKVISSKYHNDANLLGALYNFKMIVDTNK